jgi:hypothetical protein
LLRSSNSAVNGRFPNFEPPARRSRNENPVCVGVEATPSVKRSKTRNDNVAGRTKRLSKSELDEMIEEALVDAYGESEQITAFCTMIEDNMTFPFESVILGAKVKVEKVDLTDDERIVFVCRRGRERLLLDVRELEYSNPPPEGWKWIEAYRHWAQKN